MASQLSICLSSIFVLDRAGNVAAARPDRFPDIRYTVFPGDGGGASETPIDKLEALARLVGRIRNYLKIYFGHAL